MLLDAGLSMIFHTVVTALFHLLGAAISHRQGLVPESTQLVPVFSRMYTETLGGWAENAFLIGALVVLLSPLLAALAPWTSLFSDAFGRFGCINFEDPDHRKKSIVLLSVAFPVISSLLYFIIGKPGFMVIIGGSLTMLILFIVVFAAFVMKGSLASRGTRDRPEVRRRTPTHLHRRSWYFPRDQICSSTKPALPTPARYLQRPTDQSAPHSGHRPQGQAGGQSHLKQDSEWFPAKRNHAPQTN